MLATLLLAATASSGLQSQSIDSYVQKGFRDVTFNASITKKNLAELRKINPEFAQTYLFDSILIRAKEPFKLRLEASADDTKATYVIDGTRQQFRVPRLGLKQNNDLSRYPGRRQTLLEFGIPTESLFDDFYQAKFVRFDRASGDPVFDLTFPKRLSDNSRNRIWIDKERKYIARREWYGQEGQLRAIFLFERPVAVNGVTFPAGLTVRNAENKLAGVTRYSNVKANQGLADALFKL